MLITQLENTHTLLNPRPVPIGKITLLSNEKSIRKSLGSFSKEEDKKKILPVTWERN